MEKQIPLVAALVYLKQRKPSIFYVSLHFIRTRVGLNPRMSQSRNSKGERRRSDKKKLNTKKGSLHEEDSLLDSLAKKVEFSNLQRGEMSDSLN